MSHALDHSQSTNGQYPNRLAAIQAEIDEAEKAVNAAKRADRKAGDILAERSVAKAQADQAKTDTAAALRAARAHLAKLEDKQAEAQRNAS